MSNSGATLLNSNSIISGNLTSTGISLLNQINTAATNLTNTGITLLNDITSFSGQFLNSGAKFILLSGNLTQTGISLLNSLGGYYLGSKASGYITGINTGNFYPSNYNPSNYLSSMSPTGVTGVSVTGGIAITGLLNLSAGSNITLNQLDLNTLSISAAGGSASNTGSIGSGLIVLDSGSTLYGAILTGRTFLGGNYYTSVSASGIFIGHTVGTGTIMSIATGNSNTLDISPSVGTLNMGQVKSLGNITASSYVATTYSITNSLSINVTKIGMLNSMYLQWWGGSSTLFAAGLSALNPTPYTSPTLQINSGVPLIQ